MANSESQQLWYQKIMDISSYWSSVSTICSSQTTEHIYPKTLEYYHPKTVKWNETCSLWWRERVEPWVSEGTRWQSHGKVRYTLGHRVHWTPIKSTYKIKPNGASGTFVTQLLQKRRTLVYWSVLVLYLL